MVLAIPWPFQMHEVYDEGYDQSGSRVTGDTFYFLMGFTNRDPCVELDTSYNPERAALKVGPILQPVKHQPEIYTRVGIFMHHAAGRVWNNSLYVYILLPLDSARNSPASTRTTTNDIRSL